MGGGVVLSNKKILKEVLYSTTLENIKNIFKN